MAVPSKGLVLCMLVSPPLPLLSWVSLWSQAKHQNLPFKRTWSAFHFPSAAWGVTTSASYMKKKNVFLPKNNLGFKCPLQRGWNNLSWTLRRQKKVIAWVSHYLQQGRQARSHYQSGIGSNGVFPAYGFVGEEARVQTGSSEPFTSFFGLWTLATSMYTPGGALVVLFSAVVSFLPLMLWGLE